MVSRTMLETTYRKTFDRSAELYERALERFPNGVTHDGRFMRPFPVYIDRAQGSRKWTVEGRELIDYWMGHGSLILGHSHPEIAKVIAEQAARGTHYGACHELEIEWADMIRQLMPSAETVRFVSSGTEATLMAIRLARTFTGRRKVIKFRGHYHGWHDQVLDGVGPARDRPMPGVLNEVFDTLISLPEVNLDRVADTLKRDNDVACLILEPTGAMFGGVELSDEIVPGLRELTERYGVIFVMDEVVTGFRCAPGGAQEHYGVKPDLSTLAKILAAGLNGGALVGRSDIMELLELRDDSDWQTDRKMLHYGTFNANPLSAAAGIGHAQAHRRRPGHRRRQRTCGAAAKADVGGPGTEPHRRLAGLRLLLRDQDRGGGNGRRGPAGQRGAAARLEAGHAPDRSRFHGGRRPHLGGPYHRGRGTHGGGIRRRDFAAETGRHNPLTAVLPAFMLRRN